MVVLYGFGLGFGELRTSGVHDVEFGLGAQFYGFGHFGGADSDTLQERTLYTT